jgi:hypothetical protein
VWTPADGVASADPGDGEQAVAVTVGPQGFVAVGYRDEGDVRNGLAWFSPDGRTWTRVGADKVFDGVEMLDVTPGPSGFVALGMVTDAVGDRPHAVFLRSADGRTWQRVPGVRGADTTYPSSLMSGEKASSRWASMTRARPSSGTRPTGRTFDRDTLKDPTLGELTDPHASPEGYVALGSENAPPVLLLSQTR